MGNNSSKYKPVLNQQPIIDLESGYNCNHSFDYIQPEPGYDYLDIEMNEYGYQNNFDIPVNTRNNNENFFSRLYKFCCCFKKKTF